MIKKPQYLDHGGEQVYRHPYIAKNVHFYGFVIDADRNALQKNICDRYLNDPMGSPGRFVPALGRVLLVFNLIERMYARNPPDNLKGWQKEEEVAAWVLVKDTKRGKFFWHHPYMIVDNPYAMAMGREIYGFPKMLGYFTGVAAGPNAPAELKVETIVTKGSGSSYQSTKEKLIRVFRSTQPNVQHTGKAFPSLEAFSKDVLDSLKITPEQLDPHGLGEALFADLLRLRMSFIFLRQFRDAEYPELASFQSVQECRTEMTKVHDLRLYSANYQVEIWDYPTHPFRSELGLASGILDVQQAFWTCFDFEIGSCTELWRAPA